MSWVLLLLLACPLMMLFCMKGMSSGNKEEKTANQNAVQQGNQGNASEVEALQIKMAVIMEQNHELMNEIKSIKGEKAKKEMVMEGSSSEPENEETVNEVEEVVTEGEVEKIADTKEKAKKVPELKVVKKSADEENKEENAS
ncbi:DUF2933 domain-containing protein [Aquibacillus sp. 3ASR75-11]|uniref:DUF2933 domain-containing protein n=1 Tax=Terrihalobacillus insolitus TaxID=2950438 RepID=A0A9X4AKG2_9BACI|nr:DUF2933 domain-containing protein [Terrihalobacillus insolitus]MDC3412250.1 DUF2933 domain-containing protein [Terrihalobacillus insolitus]MDC3423056.1 DUF2933 domain-containing protein [Terrihalobacillus insolitus]